MLASMQDATLELKGKVLSFNTLERALNYLIYLVKMVKHFKGLVGTQWKLVDDFDRKISI